VFDPFQQFHPQFMVGHFAAAEFQQGNLGLIPQSLEEAYKVDVTSPYSSPFFPIPVETYSLI